LQNEFECSLDVGPVRPDGVHYLPPMMEGATDAASSPSDAAVQSKKSDSGLTTIVFRLNRLSLFP